MARLARVLLLAALCLARAAPDGPTGGPSKLRSSRMWVRRPGQTKPVIELVSSLSSVCARHGLDEAEMAAVSRGEAPEHQGWTCGVVRDYAPGPSKHDAAADGDAADDAVGEPVDEEGGEGEGEGEAEEEGEKDSDEAGAAPQGGMTKMLVQMCAPMLASRYLKKTFDPESAQYLLCVRAMYYGSIILRLLIQAIIGWRITAASETSETVKSSAGPLGDMMKAMGGGADSPLGPLAGMLGG